jgi:hypothetical protein
LKTPNAWNHFAYRWSQLVLVAMLALAAACGSSSKDREGDGRSGGSGGTAGIGTGGTARAGDGGSPSDAGEGSGGSSTTAGRGGSSGRSGTEPTVVAKCDFDGNDGPGCEFDGWVVDNVQGVREGSGAVHPPPVEAGESARATFGCNGQTHSQLRFWLDRRDIQASLEQMNLELYVDGVLYYTFNTFLHFREVVINVPKGEHEYEFVANFEINAPRVYVIDEIVCLLAEQTYGENGRIDFDDGFVPPELELGDWHVDNILGVHDGEAALRAPPMKAGDSATTTFSCNAEHTQVRFWLDLRDLQASLSQINLELYVDGALYYTFNTFLHFREVVINLPRDKHEYTFVANVEVDVQDLYVLDGFTCKDEEAVIGENGRIDFDDGFVPPELELGDWHVDSILGVHDGEAALHAPPMKAGDSATTTFSCNAEHTQVRFWLDLRDIQASLSQINLELYVDGALYYTFNTFLHFREVVINLPRDKHEYKFVANVEVDVQDLYVLDGFTCTDEEAVANDNGRVGFDDAFVPPELELGDWHVDNILGVHDGEAALHAPPMMAGDTATTTFDCGGQPHTRLKFWLDQRDIQASVEVINLKLYVDGDLHSTFDTFLHFREVIIDGLADEPHEYEFVASTGVDTQNLYVLDQFTCE